MDDVAPIDSPILSSNEGKSYRSISHLPVSRFPPHILYHLLKEESGISPTSAGQFGIFPEAPYMYHPRSQPAAQVHHPQPISYRRQHLF